MTNATPYAWHNGKIVPREQGAPSVSSASLHMGIGVFDGLMAYWNKDHYYLHRCKDHLDRFRSGAAKMTLNFPWTSEEMEQGILDLLTKVPQQDYYIRPIAYLADPHLWLTGMENQLINVCIFGMPVNRDIDTPLACHYSPINRISSYAIPVTWKVCGVYVNSFLARQHAKASGFDDGIMLDAEGRITEASAANLFVIEKNQLLTPTHTDIFPGITRCIVLEIAQIRGIPCVERELRPQDLSSVEGAFLVSTLLELRAISLLDQRLLYTLDHPIYKTILSDFRTITHK